MSSMFSQPIVKMEKSWKMFILSSSYGLGAMHRVGVKMSVNDVSLVKTASKL